MYRSESVFQITGAMLATAKLSLAQRLTSSQTEMVVRITNAIHVATYAIFFRHDTREIEQAFDRLGAALAENIDNGDAYEGFRNADAIYMAEQKANFEAEGAGDWQPLKRSTVKDRERQGYGPEHLILQRSKALLNAFDRGAPGNVFRVEKDHIASGIGGPAKHPGYPGKSGGNVTIGQLAIWQHYGTDKIPARPVMRPVTDDLLKRMATPIVEGYRRMIREAIQG